MAPVLSPSEVVPAALGQPAALVGCNVTDSVADEVPYERVDPTIVSQADVNDTSAELNWPCELEYCATVTA